MLAWFGYLKLHPLKLTKIDNLLTNEFLRFRWDNRQIALGLMLKYETTFSFRALLNNAQLFF